MRAHGAPGARDREAHGLLAWQSQRCPEAAEGRLAERNRSTVEFSQVPDDGEAEAVAGTGLVSAHAALQDASTHRLVQSGCHRQP